MYRDNATATTYIVAPIASPGFLTLTNSFIEPNPLNIDKAITIIINIFMCIILQM